MIQKISKDKWNVTRMRSISSHNYMAVYNNLRTIRFDVGPLMELEPDESEFYDVAITDKCTTGKCPFCYVSASTDGKHFEDICWTWRKWMSCAAYDDYKNKYGGISNKKPFQIAIGSTGEPLEHPEFCEFLETVYNTGVVPNYTTNGVILASWDKPGSKWHDTAVRILEYTAKYCGGVAVSYGNRALRRYADDAVRGLIENGDCHVMLHHIISDKKSVDEFAAALRRFDGKIHYHVLLPLMPSGRSQTGIEPGTFEYLEEVMTACGMPDNVAFGAHFVKSLEKSDTIRASLYPPESYSKNVILGKDCVKITPSSFNLSPVMTIDLSAVTDKYSGMINNQDGGDAVLKKIK